MTERLKLLYTNILPKLVAQFSYKNKHQIPKIKKIVINRCLGLNASNINILKKSLKELSLITGQLPVVTKTKKAIAGFKIRQEMNIGLKVTLRKNKMYSFLDKLININLPQIRDFRGISSKKFDKDGNFNFGLEEQLIFPEINYEDIDQIRGYNITIVLSSKKKVENKALLSALGFPFND
jgi:large subunit ribosomal protein L5